MALIDLINVSKSYGNQNILSEVDLFINQNERIAIIGKNGGGKSTLMKIISNEIELDNGRRVMTNGISVEMLAQVPKFNPDDTVKSAILNELKELNDKRARFEEVCHELSDNPDDDKLLKEQQNLNIYLDIHSGWNLKDKIERVLEKFSLKEFENSNINLLSGGEQRRVALAGLVLKKPDVLLLDEPTNHLDVYMVKFLEELLLKEPTTLVFISHDRYFIDKIATRCIEIDDCKILNFEGGYQSYLKKKELLLQSMIKTHDVLVKNLKSEEEWLRRGVKARLKRNEGRKQRVFDMREVAKKNPGQIKKIFVELERAKHSFNQSEGVNRKKMLFELESVSKSLGEKLLIKEFTCRILQGDSIAIVGKNGAGKSTLLKILQSQLPVDSGKIKSGEFKIGYFDQQRVMLDDNKSLIETFCPNGGDRVDVRGSSLHVYAYLKQFLFPKEHLEKKVGVLSGGEKNRIALALLFAQKIDCLILDEPTNDLDIPTINVLEEFVQNFQGAVIFVSHDRYFVDKIAKKLFVFMGEGLILESHQTYSEFLEMEDELNEASAQTKEQTTQVTKTKTQSVKLSYKEQQELQKLPLMIDELEDEIKTLKAKLSDPAFYLEYGIEKLTNELNKKEEELEPLIERLLSIEEKVEG